MITITVCRKPLTEPTVVKNILKHGVGGLNIDQIRTPISPDPKDGWRPNKSGTVYPENRHIYREHLAPVYCGISHTLGRWPTNLVLTEGPVVEVFDTEAGECVTNGSNPGSRVGGVRTVYGDFAGYTQSATRLTSKGSASRFYRKIGVSE